MDRETAPLRGVLETAVYADDLDAATRFYGDILGLTAFSRQAGRHVFFRCGDGVFLVFNPQTTLNESNFLDGPPVPHGATGPGHMAFRVHEAEIPAWRERLTTAGVAIERELRWPNGGHSLYFRDPAGNSIELGTPGIWGLPETPDREGSDGR
jgi:catechol 2,3-dioxygenase-like lactoylglutathione lyase family enzyme